MLHQRRPAGPAPLRISAPPVAAIMKLRAILVFTVALTACGGAQPPVGTTATGELYEAHCAEPLPVFTLGPQSHPTKEQESALCACIWSQLGDWGRAMSEKVAARKNSDVSGLSTFAFTAKFGSAVYSCGGGKL